MYKKIHNKIPKIFVVGIETANALKKNSYDDFFEKVHNIFSDYGGRPHWAKKHYYTLNDLKSLYPKWEYAKETRNQLDPNGIFKNEFLNELFS